MADKTLARPSLKAGGTLPILKAFEFKLLILFSALLFVDSLYAESLLSEEFVNTEKLVSGHQYSAGLESLAEIEPEKLDQERRAAFYFVSGVLNFREHRWEPAKSHLLRSIQLGTVLPVYAYYHLGLIEKNLGDLKAAKKNFNTALTYKPTKNIRYEIRLGLGEIALGQKHFRTAYRHFRYLQRRWKWSDKYPLILKRLVEVDLARKKRWRACRWARNLYRNFPSHPSTADWGIDLQNVELSGKKIGCLASFNDQKRRIRRLQWSGNSKRARAEIDILAKRSSLRTRYNVDKLLANFLMNEGYVDEAVQVLLKYYAQKKNNFEYLMLLGKGTAKAGRFQTAVGSYYKAHQLRAKRSKDSREALFKAAFLSYQFQDYDGAYRKFERVKKLYPRSYRARDARWHLAWIKYLRHDYKGAIKDFSQVQRLARRSRRRWRSYPKERIVYWKAMSYFRMKSYPQAKMEFEKLIAENSYSYYAQAASSRLREIPAEATMAVVRGAAGKADDDGLIKAELEVAAKAEGPMETDEASEQDLTEKEKSEVEDIAENEVPVEDSEDEKDVEPDEDDKTEMVFRSQRSRQSFQRAKQLIGLGFYGWARWELYSIERSTRNKEYRKNLVSLYSRIKSFNRSAYISSIYFSDERIKRGMLEAGDMWKAAYPMAYDNIVEHFTSEFGVEKEFALSIMRAESFFKADISSPVGAKGLMQLMPHTATQVSRLLGDEAFNTDFLIRPEVNVRVGTRYLQRLSKKFKNQIPLMAAGYNAGPHRVDTWLTSFGHLEMDEFIEHIPFKETRKYVKKVTRNYAIYKRLYSNEMNSVAWLNKSISIPPNTRHNPRETWEKL